MRGLAGATRLFPPLARSLDEAAPTHLDLDAATTGALLTESAALSAAHIGVLLPSELTAGGQRRLRARLRARTSTPRPGNERAGGLDADAFPIEAIRAELRHLRREGVVSTTGRGPGTRYHTSLGSGALVVTSQPLGRLPVRESTRVPVVGTSEVGVVPLADEEVGVGDVIAAARGLVDGRLLDDVWIGLDAGRMVEVGVGPPPATPTWRLGEGVLAPGLVDAQLNGAFGVDLVDADAAGWARVLQGLPAFGVTAVVPTFITAPLEQLVGAVLTARGHLGPPGGAPAPGAARVLGIHLEGPFLSKTYRGAHAARWLCDPSTEAVEQLLAAGGPVLLYVTLAPERAGALEAIGLLRAAGVRVALGHADASDAQVAAAVDMGASLVTHLFNAQRPLRHRDPGVVGAALADPRLTVGLIADLVHVEPTAVRVAFAAAAGRVMLVSDGIAALGMPEGSYVLGGQQVTVAEGRPPVRDDGTLAGSALRLDAAVGNVIGCGVEPVLALEAASRVPADALGRPELGRIAPGSPADLVWLGPDWRTRATWLGGELVHGTPPRGHGADEGAGAAT